MRVCVSGAGGFVGRHLAAEMTSAGHEVVGVGKAELNESTGKHLTDYVQGDLIDGWPQNLLNVDCIVHLAALSAVGPSFDKPQLYIESNSAMVTNLGEALLEKETPPRVLIVSSGALYDSEQQLPIAEGGDIAFSSPYAVSKALVESQASYYQRRGLDWVVARPFNHIGPYQGAGFLLPDLVDSVRRAEQSGQAIIAGDLGTERDYTDVRDVVLAYRHLVETPTLNCRVYNVCSGRSVSGTELLEGIVDALGVRPRPVKVDPDRVRPNEPRRIVGDPSRIMSDTGWRPTVALTKSISDFIAG